uniref:Neuromedin-S n=1 Tax=Panthera tigris altaica TaxID=74533 RepID=A0A8C9KCN0_PANTA
MKQLPPQFVSILAIYCFCMLQIPSSGFPRPLADPPDDLDIMQLEVPCYSVMFFFFLFFLFYYSRTQEPTHPVKKGCVPPSLRPLLRFPPVHPLMRLAAQLANRRMKRFQQHGYIMVCVFMLQDHTATLGRPFFLFRPRNGRNTEANTQ